MVGFWVRDCQLLCVSTWQKAENRFFEDSFIKARIRAPPSWPHHLPEAPPPNTTTLRLRFQPGDSEGGARRHTFCPRHLLFSLYRAEETAWSTERLHCPALTRSPILRRFSYCCVCRIRDKNCRRGLLGSPVSSSLPVLTTFCLSDNCHSGGRWCLLMVLVCIS